MDSIELNNMRDGASEARENCAVQPVMTVISEGKYNLSLRLVRL